MKAEPIVVTKSASDKRNYRALILENKLKVLLISDPSTDKSAASLSVGAGSLSNPKDLPGLAHFCEHMLFLGTEKYPVENEFDKFLSDNGGGSNAYTDEDHTNYHFDVSPKELGAALDRFAYFFINPLFTASATEREIQAVNSEHEQNIPDDSWRSSDIQKHTSDPNHPYQHFATGNLDSLWTLPKEKKIDIISALMEYHSKFYSANIMTLAVLGSENLDELEEMVKPLFSQVKNKDVELSVWNSTPFGPNEVGVLIRVLPIKDIRQMSIVFPFPDTTSSYKAASDQYLTHLLGHEGSGSILSLLKKKGWANELTAEIHALGRGFGAATIDFELTKDGLMHVNDVALILFQYLEMLRREGPQKWIWEELQGIEAMKFRFKDQKPAESTVCDLTPKMLLYPLEDVLSAEYLITQYNPEEIEQWLTHLVPERCRITVFAKENESKVNLLEEYYEIQYSVEKIDAKLINEWKNCVLNEALHPPLPNEFIPSSFEIKMPRQDWGIIPRVILNTSMSRVFFLQDNEFLLPKAVVRIEMFSPLPLQSAFNRVMTGILKKTVEDSLSEITYNATVSDYQYALLDNIYGLQLHVTGYDDKLGHLLQKIVERLVNFCCDEQRFEVIKEAYLRELKNWRRAQPYSHTHWYISYLLGEKRWTHDERIEALQGAKKLDFDNFLSDFLLNLKFEWLLYGNLCEMEATALVRKCDAIFEEKGTKPLPKEQEIRIRELKLKPGADYVYIGEHHTHSDSCLNVLFQAGEEENRSNVLIELMDQLVYDSCYTQLRTKEQLGYTVWSGVRKSNGTRAFQILVQSAFEPSYIDSRVDAYLQSLRSTLRNMSEEEFLQHRNALAVRKGEKPKSIEARAEKLWQEIVAREYNFARVETELKELESVTLPETIEFFEFLIGVPATKRKRLNIHIVSKSKKKKAKKSPVVPDVTSEPLIERNPCVIENVCDWKACHEFFPASCAASVPPVMEVIGKSQKRIF